MKRILITTVAVASLVWLTLDSVHAVRWQAGQRTAQQVVSYYENVHGVLPDFSSRQQMVDNAMQACHYLSTNPDLSELKESMTTSKIGGTEAVTTYVAAIWYLCPEHKHLLKEW